MLRIFGRGFDSRRLHQNHRPLHLPAWPSARRAGRGGLFGLCLSFLLAGAAAVPPSALGQEAEISAPRLTVHVKSFPQITRVTFESDQAVPFFTLLVAGPGEERSSRLVIRPEGRVVIEGKDWPKNVGDGVVRQIRLSSGDVTTFTVDLGESFLDYRTFSLEQPRRFVVDLRRGKSAKAAEKAAPRQGADEPSRRPVPKETPGEFVLVVDPAHGGDRAGSVGAAGIREKDWVLSLARAIQKAGSSLSPRVDVVLTREADYTLPVRERAAVAGRGRASAYLSLHAARMGGEAKRAVNVYTQSYAGMIGGTAGKTVSALDFPLVGGVRKTTLWDFQQFSAIQESVRLGEALKKSLSAAREVQETALRQVPLVELAALTVPGVAVEFEFLGDAAAEGILKDPAFQARMAKLLVESIRKAVRPPSSPEGSAAPSSSAGKKAPGPVNP
ncbi:MAG: N-acetylmuramoyl-L-alanine amidase [Nitrospirae bacterium]|nr:N-acetylmuramoyl-L-alanine amidase [Nitrospirota bacterium]